MPSTSVYVGIDVACAVGKRLPICVVSAGNRLALQAMPMHLMADIPRGGGNQEIRTPDPFQKAATDVVTAISRIADKMAWQVERIAIDAPAAPPATGPRASEKALASCGLSSFRTPARDEWAAIKQKCANHLGSGGSVARLPYANKIWMLFGFQLFAQLKARFRAEVIEVYPFAIVRALLPKCAHKSTERGYREQLDAVAARTGWEPRSLEARLKANVPGARHDRLDAFMAAWVASLPRERRCAYGDPKRLDDAIWVPR